MPRVGRRKAGRGRAAKRKKVQTFRYRAVRAVLGAGGRRTFTLRLRGKGLKAAKKAFKRGKLSRARVTVSATDAVGNTATKRLSLKVKKPKRKRRKGRAKRSTVVLGASGARAPPR